MLKQISSTRLIGKQHAFYGNQHVKNVAPKEPSNLAMFKTGLVTSTMLLTIAVACYFQLTRPAIFSPVGKAHADYEHVATPSATLTPIPATSSRVSASGQEAETPAEVAGLTDAHTQYIYTKKHADIIIRVWNNETSQGKNTTSDPTALHQYCKSINKTNEFGYDPQDRKCFDTFEASVDTINTWFDTCLQTRNLSQCLERYSGNSNSYIAKFLNY